MNTREVTTTESTDILADSALRESPLLDRILRKRLLAALKGLCACRITIEEKSETVILGTPASKPAETLVAHIHVHDSAFYRQVGLNGSVGAGEAYMDGLWDCDDLVSLIRILVRNRDHLDAMETGLARLGGSAMRIWGALMRNTRKGSRRNIAAHYDLGNDLFKLFLDDSLMYSSAIYANEDDTLEAASSRKLERICQKLNLGPQHHLLEIGTGWGGFALYAAKHYGCRVTTTTISKEQHDRARERIEAAGLGDRITLLLEDYRDLKGSFDRVVSIEMIEAIGHQYLDTYFRTIDHLLKPDGMALIQAITIEDHRYKQALKSVDFIQRFIFPGSFIPSISAMTDAIGRNSNMKLFNLEDIGPSYALTLRAWRKRFLDRIEQVRALGYPDRFVRMWVFYLAYCEGGFIERSIGDVQMLLCKPEARPTQFVPSLQSVNPT
ncbi:MAG TPA: cyclopropane-fatty-acyl-phospholipid synthase family protein [Dokdonella sp.]|uniref:cyclopropane-fatty-acyl-phospholipid synthase family protein n=1 Tax=Dokdonella sp. TaxID=2291710 RepID=UPI002D80031D|nr:cyclopropane-fatty-acyl-phospholipid synthase family protein [Dokdonella sp.]HET9034342.1 cyclopropane-fatty-acyl-phospholipid synthase family protein [Dokdonella sp.]